MSKLFGYSRRNGQDWAKTNAYSDIDIDNIKDPDGGSVTELPTAIPSPFARVDLVKTAFSNIVKSNEGKLKAYNAPNGTVIASEFDEKLVSDCLDLAEILFNIDNLKDQIRIIVWDREFELTKLKSNSAKQRSFAETLELYLEQDKNSYNFDLVKRLYLIEYKDKIIGCTSPCTLFFSTANDLSQAQITLTNNDKTFDEHYCPLYERDSEFQKYLYLLFKSNPIFKEKLKVFDEYLSKNLRILENHNPKLFFEINRLPSGSFYTSYAELDTGISGSIIEVIGVPLRKRKREDIYIAIKESDFIIKSDKFKGDKRPLVLQNGLSKSLNYVNANWDVNYNVPYLDIETDLKKRSLPGVNIRYPYLTVSDFLEPYLIRLVYPINKEKFFDGNVKIEAGADSKGYLVPLKKKFFDFFNSDDIVSPLPDKPQLEMVQVAAGSVKVKLRIPISKHDEFISFERTYHPTRDGALSKPDEENNKGVIVEHQLGITLFPFIKISERNIDPYYRIQLVDRDVTGLLKNSDYDLKFFSNHHQESLEVRAKKTRRNKKELGSAEAATTQYYVLHNEFDFIQVRNLMVSSGVSGIIIPNWQPFHQGNETFSFSVDFGTTNTHIEYKVGNGSPKPFDITPDDLQIATLFHPLKTTEDFGGTGAIAIRELIDHEFVPEYLGNSSEFKFPHRTVIAESHSLNIETETFSLADFNIPFIYERKPENDRIHSNLKWSRNEFGNEKRVRAYFEKIIMLLRNKVLLNRGNLSQTRLIWFYPSSMKPARKSSLERTWNELFSQYFKATHQPIGIIESLAPFYYFRGVNRLQGGAFKPVVSIDIGGGTTDIVIFKANKPLLLTSFKFAGNTLFGDGFSEYGAASSNGFVNKYFQYFENLLSTNKLYDLSKVLSSIKEKNRSEDINAFFFSIENNQRIKDKQLFSFNSILAKDEDLKILFIYFYSAIIYHVAEIMKFKAIGLPKHLIFSGTGSKILNIISNEKTLASLAKLIFEEVLGQGFDADGLTIESEPEMPKEVTCKGGLMSNSEDLSIEVKDIKTTLTCLENKEIYSLSYEMLDVNNKEEIVEYVSKFNTFFLALNNKYSFNDYFEVSIDSMNIFKDEINKNIREYLEGGIDYNRKLDDRGLDDKEIEESLFFYPLIGTINNLANQLSQLSPLNK